MKKPVSIIINLLIILVICAILGIITLFFFQLRSYASARNAYDRIKLEAISPSTDAYERKVDFTIVESNSNGKCYWIYLPDSAIDYPIVQADDNEKYLSTDAYGNASKSGAIFLDCDNSVLMDDKKSIIYGHSMKDGSMFHELHSYAKNDYAITHSKLYIYMDDSEVYEYDLRFVINADCYDANIYDISASQSVQDFFDYAGSIASACYGENNGGNILVLSTCIKGNRRRVVVFQKQ